jgi:spore germination protein YaaH
MLFLSCQTKVEYGPDTYVPDTGFKVVGYLGGGNFDEIDSIEIIKLTYLNLAFGNPDKDGNLLFDGGFDVDPIVKKGHDAGLKVYISLAGGGRPDTVIWKSVLEPEMRSKFVAKLVEYVEVHNMDGIVVDIEGNLLPYVLERYNPFVVELRQALHAKGKGMTAALGATRIHPTINQEALEAYDFINVMVYDKTGVWRPDNIGPHSPFSFAEDAMKFWLEEKKIPADRITLGVPFYGFDFTPRARYIDYSEIIRNDPSLAYVDSTGMRYYNGIPIIVRKVELAKKMNLGGVMIWEISSDTRGDLSLLKALDQAVKLVGCEAKIFFKDEDGDGFGDITRPFTACEAPDGYVADNTDSNDTDKNVHL